MGCGCGGGGFRSGGVGTPRRSVATPVQLQRIQGSARPQPHGSGQSPTAPARIVQLQSMSMQRKNARRQV